VERRDNQRPKRARERVVEVKNETETETETKKEPTKVARQKTEDPSVQGQGKMWWRRRSHQVRKRKTVLLRITLYCEGQHANVCGRFSK
jgi:hypothetical protein